MIHACTIEDNAMVDIGSTVLDGAVVSNKAILGPGSLLLEGQRVPTGELWAGSPAKFVRKLSEEEMNAIANIAQKYRELADKHDEYHTLDQKTLEMMKDDVYDNALSSNYRSERYF
jgi:gamma-carbonic anhydrase